MEKLLERIYDGLTSSPLNTVGALIIFLIALPLIRAGFRDRSPAPPAPQPPPVPIQIESPWLTQQVIEMHFEIEQIKERLGIVSNQVKGIATLLRRRERRDPKK
ncbi:hypothetical protein [Bradyrhizobium elkanii]|uniref:hypothetical protein n=1 Tax=Bradyrhizobium elkanii TaxID=29448 RepID=UPI000841C27B|nr:hypothetical protein [Bradyrhizobium elkanii]ODM71663.1 hypothetical protein A6X20_06895 [Bradyrhizobium elkanii]ODM79035.1 hypothetical protein A6452_28480 [Bradyrhizobium elkanii]